MEQQQQRTLFLSLSLFSLWRIWKRLSRCCCCLLLLLLLLGFCCCSSPFSISLTLSRSLTRSRGTVLMFRPTDADSSSSSSVEWPSSRRRRRCSPLFPWGCFFCVCVFCTSVLCRPPLPDMVHHHQANITLTPTRCCCCCCHRETLEAIVQVVTGNFVFHFYAETRWQFDSLILKLDEYQVASASRRRRRRRRGSGREILNAILREENNNTMRTVDDA